MATDWAADVKKYVAKADDAAIAGIVRYCGIALRNRDSALVAFSDKAETDRVRNNFLKKKLGLTQADSVLDAAIAKVGEQMKADRTKNRVTVYYLLASEFKALGQFIKAAPAAKKAPAAKSAATKAAPKPAPAKTKTAAKAVGAAAVAAGAVTKAKPAKAAASKPAPAKKVAAPKTAPTKKAAAPAKATTVKAAAPAANATQGLLDKAATKASDAAKSAPKVVAAAAAGTAAAVGAAAAGAAKAADAATSAVGSAADKAGATMSAASKAAASTVDDGSEMNWFWWVVGLAVAAFLLWFMFLRGPDADDATSAESAASAAASDVGTDLAAAPTEGSAAIPAGAGVTSEMRDGKPVVKVYFDTGMTDVSPDFAKTAGGLKSWLDTHSGASLTVSGYSDPSGNAAANAELSKQRAQAVQSALVAAGIPATSAALVKPEVTADATVSKEAARRVEVVVK
jgi:outer membrane protein OmpA-like peptidoglycan-associated protein